MQVTLSFTGVCAGGNHVSLSVNGSRTLTLIKNDILQDTGWDAGSEDYAIIRELRRYFKREGITTWAAARNALTDLSLDI